MRAGVSRTTVSFVLNDSIEGTKIPDETRRRVLEMASEMGYRRNEMARAIVTGKSHTLAVLIHDHPREHIASMLTGVLGEITRQGYTAKVLQLPFVEDSDAEEVVAMVQKCAEWRVDGIISVTLNAGTTRLILDEIQAMQVPILSLATRGADAIPLLCTDDRSGLESTLNHLMKLGHRYISFVSGDKAENPALNREKLFESLLAAHDLPITAQSLIWADWYDIGLIHAALERTFASPFPPTALICSSDSIALVAVRWARRHGLPVPERLSVVGYGNSSHCALLDPSLSSIAQPFNELGRKAVRSILQSIETKKPIAHDLSNDDLQEYLIARESIGPPPL